MKRTLLKTLLQYPQLKINELSQIIIFHKLGYLDHILVDSREDQ